MCYCSQPAEVSVLGYFNVAIITVYDNSQSQLSSGQLRKSLAKANRLRLTTVLTGFVNH